MWRIFYFVLFCSAAGLACLVPKTLVKERFPQSLGLKRRTVVNRVSRDCFPPPFSLAVSSGLPKNTPYCIAYWIAHFILLYILLFIFYNFYFFFTYIYIYPLVLLHIFHCPLSRPDLTYISLLIMFCIIEL